MTARAIAVDGGNSKTDLALVTADGELLGLMQHVAAYERLAAQAAVAGDPVLVRKALLTHPLIAQDAVVEELMERMFVGSAV